MIESHEEAYESLRQVNDSIYFGMSSFQLGHHIVKIEAALFYTLRNDTVSERVYYVTGGGYTWYRYVVLSRLYAV